MTEHTNSARLDRTRDDQDAQPAHERTATHSDVHTTAGGAGDVAEHDDRCSRCGKYGGDVGPLPNPHANFNADAAFCLSCWAAVTAEETELSVPEAYAVAGPALDIDDATIGELSGFPTGDVRQQRARALDRVEREVDDDRERAREAVRAVEGIPHVSGT